MKVEFSWRDHRFKYRWQSKTVELDVIPRIGEDVAIDLGFRDKVTAVEWNLYDDNPSIDITLGEEP